MASHPSLFVYCDGCRIYLIYSKPGPLFSESGRKWVVNGHYRRRSGWAGTARRRKSCPQPDGVS